MALLYDAGNRLQRGQKLVTLGFNKKHILNSYKDNLRNNSVDSDKKRIDFNNLNEKLILYKDCIGMWMKKDNFFCWRVLPTYQHFPHSLSATYTQLS